MPDDTRPAHITRLLTAAIAALALGLGIAACGDDDDEGDSGDEAASAEQVTVTATEYDFELSATPTSETKEITFDNQGKEPHSLIFAELNEGFTVDEAFELEGRKGSARLIAQTNARPGKSFTVKIDEPLTPGSYAMLCPIPGPEGKVHYELGQLEEFDIG